MDEMQVFIQHELVVGKYARPALSTKPFEPYGLLDISTLPHDTAARVRGGIVNTGRQSGAPATFLIPNDPPGLHFRSFWIPF